MHIARTTLTLATGLAVAAGTPGAMSSPVLAQSAVTQSAVAQSAAAQSAVAQSAEVRIGTGARAVRDARGTVWPAARGFVGGRPAVPIRTPTPIARTADDALYRTARVGNTTLRQPVTAGTYDVTLRFAERFWNAPRRRLFDVFAEGSPVLRNVDVFRAVGRNAAWDARVRVRVTDGTLDLFFRSRIDVATVSAVRIVPVAGPPVRSPVSVARPGPTNTGVPGGTPLRVHEGNLTITQAGARYDALDIRGFVTIKAPNVRITRSIIRGGRATTNIGLVTNYAAGATGFVLEDSTLVPRYPSVWIDGIKGGNFTARRVDSYGTNDNVKVHGDNVRVERSWLHDTVHRPNDPNLGGAPTHNDGVQVLGGRNIRVLGNDISTAHNAGVQVTQDYRATTDLQVNGNWINGGGCSVNLAHKDLARMSGITVSGNRFGRNTRIPDCAIIASRATAFTASGNVWLDDGRPVRVRDGG